MRLGCLRSGSHDVRAQRFFRTIDWNELRERRAPAPWLPVLANPLDTSNFEVYDEDDEVEHFWGQDDWANGF